MTQTLFFKDKVSNLFNLYSFPLIAPKEDFCHAYIGSISYCIVDFLEHLESQILMSSNKNSPIFLKDDVNSILWNLSLLEAITKNTECSCLAFFRGKEYTINVPMWVIQIAITKGSGLHKVTNIINQEQK